MNKVPQTISVTELRSKTKDVIQKVIQDNQPIYIIYNSQIPACIVSTDFLKSNQVQPKKNLDQYAGFLKDSQAFQGDPVKYQRKLRDEWE